MKRKASTPIDFSPAILLPMWTIAAIVGYGLSVWAAETLLARDSAVEKPTTIRRNLPASVSLAAANSQRRPAGVLSAKFVICPSPDITAAVATALPAAIPAPVSEIPPVASPASVPVVRGTPAEMRRAALAPVLAVAPALDSRAIVRMTTRKPFVSCPL